MEKIVDKQEVTVMGLGTDIKAKEVEEKENFTRVPGTRVRASTRTNYKVIWVFIGLVVALTAGFYYLFTFVFRLLELRRRNGERVKDLLRGRLDEQQHQRQRDTYY